MTKTQTRKTEFSARPMILVTALLVAGCSGSEQQQTEPVNGEANGAPVENSSLNGNAKKVSEGEGMNNATAKGGNNFSGANGGNNFSAANGAAVNNAVLNNSGVGGNPLANPTTANAVPLNQSAPLNEGAATGLTNSALPGTNTAPINGTNIAPTNSATPPATAAAPTEPAKPTVSWDRMNASPMANPQMNWPGRGKVKYVTRRATKHATPNGPVVGEMETGDHPLVYQDGNWVELQNGTFIKGDSMTDKGVGYERNSH